MKSFDDPMYGPSEMQAVFDHYGLSWPAGYGGERSIRCPVHDDRQASASLNLSKGVFHCHACGAKGSAVDVVMGREGVEFEQARQYLAEAVGIEDRAVRSGVSGQPRRRVHDSSRDTGRRSRYVPSWLRDR